MWNYKLIQREDIVKERDTPQPAGASGALQLWCGDPRPPASRIPGDRAPLLTNEKIESNKTLNMPNNHSLTEIKVSIQFG